MESGVAKAGEVGLEEGKVVDLLQGGNVRVPLNDLLQQSAGWPFNDFRRLTIHDFMFHFKQIDTNASNFSESTGNK